MKLTTSARVYLAIFVILLVSAVAGCGGGSPVNPDPVEWFSGVFIDQQPDGSPGGKIIQAINLPKGRETFVWFRALSLLGSYDPADPSAPWTVVTKEYSPKLTIVGSPSGSYMPNPGLKRVQCHLNAGAQYKVVWEPPADSPLGSVHYYLEIEELGIRTDLWVAVIDGNINPPPVNICGHDHPEAINGFWWDCRPDGNGGMIWANTGIPVQTCDREPEPIGGYWWACEPINDGYGGKVWRNTGVPVDQPSGELHAYGAQGEFKGGGVVSIMQANGCHMDWYLGDSKVSSSDVNFESEMLPTWVWDKSLSEIVTIIWAEPNDPDLEDGGNQLVNPGNWGVGFHHSIFSCFGTIEIIHREGFAAQLKSALKAKGMKLIPHPDYPEAISIVVKDDD